MKQIIAILAVIFALTSPMVHAQMSFIPDENKTFFSNPIQFVDVKESFFKYQMFEPIRVPVLIPQENKNDGILNDFSKDLRSELSNGKWDSILNKKQTDDNLKVTASLSLIKISNPDTINLFGNPLSGFTDQMLVFNEPALFSNTLLVYSFKNSNKKI